MNGDVDVHSIVAASLPTSHPSTAPRRHLDMSVKWKAPSLPTGHVDLFIGILSAGNHFAERMAVRKSWMQYEIVKSANVVIRFFVAMVSVLNRWICQSSYMKTFLLLPVLFLEFVFL